MEAPEIKQMMKDSAFIKKSQRRQQVKWINKQAYLWFWTLKDTWLCQHVKKAEESHPIKNQG